MSTSPGHRRPQTSHGLQESTLQVDNRLSAHSCPSARGWPAAHGSRTRARVSSAAPFSPLRRSPCHCQHTQSTRQARGSGIPATPSAHTQGRGKNAALSRPGPWTRRPPDRHVVMASQAVRILSKLKLSPNSLLAFDPAEGRSFSLLSSPAALRPPPPPLPPPPPPPGTCFSAAIFPLRRRAGRERGGERPGGGRERDLPGRADGIVADSAPLTDSRSTRPGLEVAARLRVGWTLGGRKDAEPDLGRGKAGAGDKPTACPLRARRLLTDPPRPPPTSALFPGLMAHHQAGVSTAGTFPGRLAFTGLRGQGGVVTASPEMRVLRFQTLSVHSGGPDPLQTPRVSSGGGHEGAE